MHLDLAAGAVSVAGQILHSAGSGPLASLGPCECWQISIPFMQPSKKGQAVRGFLIAAHQTVIALYECTIGLS